MQLGVQNNYIQFAFKHIISVIIIFLKAKTHFCFTRVYTLNMKVACDADMLLFSMLHEASYQQNI